jgi:hypothetical protein
MKSQDRNCPPFKIPHCPYTQKWEEGFSHSDPKSITEMLTSLAFMHVVLFCNYLFSLFSHFWPLCDCFNPSPFWYASAKENYCAIQNWSWIQDQISHSYTLPRLWEFHNKSMDKIPPTLPYPLRYALTIPSNKKNLLWSDCRVGRQGEVHLLQ